MTAADWVEATGIPMPACKMQGCCCRGASPSIPFGQLMEKAAQGDDFARNFFSIFIPHASHHDARQVVPGLVERTLTAAQKDTAFTCPEKDVVFYHCRFIGDDNRCQIWEDRPALCRAYPDSPFLVFAPNCAFEPWAQAVREKFSHMKAEIQHLKGLQAELADLQRGNLDTKIDAAIWNVDNQYNLSMVLLLTPMFLVSPVGSVYYLFV
jgi:Fe-S-cluster containining protein